MSLRKNYGRTYQSRLKPIPFWCRRFEVCAGWARDQSSNRIEMLMRKVKANQEKGHAE